MPNYSGFIKNIEERQTQFLHANGYFIDHPLEKKLSRKQPPHLANSYIKLDDGTILALSSTSLGGHVLGQGAFGRGKLAMDFNGYLYAIKIEKTNTPLQARENAALHNLRFLAHPKTAIKREDSSEKYYTSMVYLGKNLEENLYAVDANYASSLARKIAWALHQLHSGYLSQNAIGYAHLDLRPGNIVIDDKNQIHLIDLGTAHSLDEEYHSASFTTSIYAPTTYDEQQYEKDEYEALVGHRLMELGPKKIDVFALKRTLYLPSLGQDSCDYGYCLFSRNGFTSLPVELKEMIDTTNIETAMSRKNTDTPLGIAVACLALECGIDINAFNKLCIQSQEQLCEIASTYALPVSEDDDERMHDNYKQMKDEIQIFLQQLTLKPGL